MPDYPLVYAQYISPPDTYGWRTMRLFLVERSYLYDVECVGMYVGGKWEFDTITLMRTWPPASVFFYNHNEDHETSDSEAFKSLGQAITDELNDQAVAAAERMYER